MSVYLLTNSVGHAATAAAVTTGTLAPGYSAYDAISGPRNRTVRGGVSGSHRYRYDCPSTQVTHVVVSRMDLFKNTLDADTVQVQYGAANSTDSTTDVGDLDLVGPTRQDWVKPIARTSSAFALLLNSSETTRAFEYGKVYFSKAFSFGEEPDFGPSVHIRRTEREEYVKPCVGYYPYAVEASFGITFSDVSLAKVLEFENDLPLSHPFFFYDDSADIFAHQLEHVILRGWGWDRVGDDQFNINLSLARLCHYN